MPRPELASRRVLHLESQKPLDRGAVAQRRAPIQSATRTERRFGAWRPASPAHGRKAHHSLCTRRRSPRSRRRSCAGSPEQPSRYSNTALPSCRGVVRRSPGLRVVPCRRRGPLRVPACSRCRLQLARARQWLRRLHDTEHARDGPEDDPERNVLLARARDRRGRLGLPVDGGPIVSQGVDRRGGVAIAGRRRGPLVRNRPAQAWLVGGAGSVELPGVARERPVARLAGLPPRGRPDRDPESAGELAGSLDRTCNGHVLLERDPPGRGGEPRRRLGDRIVLVDLAVDDHARR